MIVALIHLDIDGSLTSEYIYRLIIINDLPVCNASEKKSPVSNSKQYLRIYYLSLLFQQGKVLKMADEAEDLAPEIEEVPEEEE